MEFDKVKDILDNPTHEEFSFYADFVNESIKELELSKDSKILNIGTGWGIMTIILALSDFNVLMGEPKRKTKGCHHARYHNEFYSNWKESANAADVESKIKNQHLDNEYLPFPDSSFDTMFIPDTLQHIENRKVSAQGVLNGC